MKEIINTYKKQVHHFLDNYDESIPVEGALSAAGQDLQEALVMQRRRLNKRRLRLGVEESDIETNSFTESFHDGSQDIGYFRENLKVNKRYIYQDGKISEIPKLACREYYVKDNLGEAQQVTSVDAAWRIHSLYRRNTEHYDQERFDSKNATEDSFVYFMLPFMGMLAAFFLSIFVTMTISAFNIRISIKLWYLPTILAGFGVVASLILWKKHKDRRVASREVLSRIRDRFPDFSAEKFMAMAAGRLKCICYAEEARELNTFANTDLSAFVAAHKDVVNCDQRDFFFQSFVAGDEWFCIEAEVPVWLDKDVRSHVKQEKETIHIKFVRPVASIMSIDFYHDWYVAEVEV